VFIGKKLNPKVHYDDYTQSWISKPEMKGNPLATAPFSRGGKDWRVPVPRKYTYPGTDRALKQIITDQKPVMQYYTPRGERSTWSKAQYTVYKEEQLATRAERWAARKPTLDAIAKDINSRSTSKYRSITDGSRNRTVLGVVPGRKDGEPAVEKDGKGIPIVEKDESEKDDSDSGSESDSEEEVVIVKKEGEAESSKVKPIRAASKEIVKKAKSTQYGSKTPSDQARVRKRAHVSDSEDTGNEDTAPTKKGPKRSGKPVKSKSKQKSSNKWVVPDSSDESTDELEYMQNEGLTIIHDFWPSPWRVMAAALVTSDRINKSVSVSHL
jgi:hypothetical protein